VNDEPQFLAYYSDTKNVLYMMHKIVTGQVLKNGVRTLITCGCKFMVSEKKMGSAILAALIAHHPPISVLCNHNLWINSKLSAELTYPLR
jgi:hypothetical protein